MNAHARIPLATRLLRPRYAREVAFLAAEHRRSGIDPLPVDRRGELELACEVRSRGVSDRRVARSARRIRRLAGSGQRQVQLARSYLATLSGADDVVAVLDGRAMALADVRVRAATLTATVDADLHARRLDRASRPLRLVGYGLLLVDAVALVIVFGFLLNVDWSRPDPANLITTVALSVFGAAVQAVLALQLGRRLWAWRHTDRADDDGVDVRSGGAGAPEFPPRAAVILGYAGFLALVSTLAAGAIFMRVQAEGTAAEAGGLAVALGLLLAASALAAPWCLVADETYAQSPDNRLMCAAGLIVARADRWRRELERRARRHLDAAVRRLWRAEWRLAATVHRIGHDHLTAHRTLLGARGLAWGTTVCSAPELLPPRAEPDVAAARSVLPMVVAGDHRCLTVPVEQLRSAVVAARVDYVTAVDRMVPDELDLAI